MSYSVPDVSHALQAYIANTQYELVIFDCDGVLIDSESLSKQTLLNMLAELGVLVNSEYFDVHFLGQSYAHMVTKIHEDYAVLLPDDFQLLYQNTLLNRFAEELQPTPAIEHVLSRLAIPVCVATSSGPERVKRALHLTQLSAYFGEHVFTSSEVKHGKPAPDLFLHAAQQMGIDPSRCLVIEDSSAGLRAAKAANMDCIWYTGASHLVDLTYKDLTDSDNSSNEFLINIPHWETLFSCFPQLQTLVEGNRSGNNF